MANLLHLGVLAAAAWAGVGLALQRGKARAFGQRTLYSAPAGEATAGVRYAFTGALAPGAKESVREHQPSYLAGLALHAGIGTALILLVLALGGWTVPAPLRLPVRALLALGALGGAGLLLKRLLKPELRGLSHPDDFLSNLLATGFVTLALVGPRPLWLGSAILLLAYVPIGKLRHSLFFFVARRQLGAFFGRRGVFPPGGAHVR